MGMVESGGENFLKFCAVFLVRVSKLLYICIAPTVKAQFKGRPAFGSGHCKLASVHAGH